MECSDPILTHPVLRRWLTGWLLCSLMAAANADSLRLSGSSWVHDAPTKIAHRQGYFDSADQTVEVSYETSGKASLQRLLAGEVDLALVAATPLAHALLHQGEREGSDLVVLASISLSNQTHHVLAASERGITAPTDLRGRRVGALRNSSAEFYWSLFAPLHGLDSEAVELVNVPVDAMRQALESGEVDAVVTWDPWVYRLQRQVDVDTVTFSERQIYTLNWLLVSQRELVERRQGAVEQVLRGYERAINDIHEAPDVARRLHGEGSDLPADYLRKMEEKIIYHLSLQWSTLINIEQQLDWLQTQPEYAHLERPGPGRYLYPGPLRAIASQRVLLLDIFDEEDAP